MTRISRWQAQSLFPFITRRCLSSTKHCRAARSTTVQRGNAFEDRSLKLLEETMSMSLKRVGGKEDGGIDLVGWWWLPSHDSKSLKSPRRRLRIIGQCKAEKKKMGPNYVRELEGVLHRFLTVPSSTSLLDDDNEDSEEYPKYLSLERLPYPLVALLISQSPFTKSTILRAHSSPIPFFLLHLPPLDENVDDKEKKEEDVNEEDGEKEENLGKLGVALANPALCGSNGLLRGQVEVRWERHPMGESGRPGLWWKNKRLRSWVPNIEAPILIKSKRARNYSPDQDEKEGL